MTDPNEGLTDRELQLMRWARSQGLIQAYESATQIAVAYESAGEPVAPVLARLAASAVEAAQPQHPTFNQHTPDPDGTTAAVLLQQHTNQAPGDLT